MKHIFTASISVFFFICVFSQAGTLDNSFSTDGKTAIGFVKNGTGTADVCYAMALQSDGKIILAGYSNATASGFNDFVVMRLNLDGTLDHTFNNKGFIFIDFSGFDDYAYAVAIQSDGRIVVAGETRNSNARSRVGLVRLVPSGVPDPTFGANFSGKVITDFGSGTIAAALGLAIQNDGKIVVAGSFYKTATECLLVRYNTSGSLDQSFGVLGKSLTNFGTAETANGVAIQSDGKIVVGCSSTPFQNSHFLVARFTSAGFLDNTFGNSGKTIAKVGTYDWCAAVVLQSNGKIVAVGYGIQSNTDVVVLRYTTSGALDNNFSTDGIVTTDFGGNDGAFAAAIQSDGKIIVAGGSSENFALARYNTNGSLDHTFSSDGKTITNFGHNENAASVGIMSDGRIVAAGTSDIEYSINDNFAIARYHGDNAAPEIVAGKWPDEEIIITETSNENKISGEKSPSVHVYPNPVANILHVEGLNTSSPVILSITNLHGTVIRTASAYGNECSLNVSSLKAGTYILDVQTQDGKASFQFLKQ